MSIYSLFDKRVVVAWIMAAVLPFYSLTASAEAEKENAETETQKIEASAGEPGSDVAQNPIILVIDQNRVIYQSKAGQSMTEQLQKLQQTADKELSTIIKVVEDEAKALAKNKSQFSHEEFARKEQELLTKGQNLNALRNVKLRELGLSEKNATDIISADLRDILGDIVKVKGATLLLDKASVMFAANTIDITEEALVALDEKVSTVKVERVDLLTKNQK